MPAGVQHRLLYLCVCQVRVCTVATHARVCCAVIAVHRIGVCVVSLVSNVGIMRICTYVWMRAY